MSDARRGLICCVLGVAALAGAAWNWTGNHAASHSVVALVVAAGTGLAWWRPRWVAAESGYRILLVIAVPGLVLASHEAIDGDLSRPGEMYLRGRRMNYPDVMIGLYPDRDGYRFLKAQQMGLCRQPLESLEESKLPTGACRELGNATLEQIRGELERAIATGVTSNEDLLRIYSEVLEELGAEGPAVERARRSLYRHHPHLRPADPGSP